jgi:hypothetical protein
VRIAARSRADCRRLVAAVAGLIIDNNGVQRESQGWVMPVVAGAHDR